MVDLDPKVLSTFVGDSSRDWSRLRPFSVRGEVHAPLLGDVRVTRVPSPDDVERLQQSFPGAMFSSYVSEGMQLRDLPNQDSYSFELADLFLGGNSRQELTENFREAMKILEFRFSRKVQTNYD